MSKSIGPMDKKVVCLMRKNIESENFDIETMAINDPEGAIEYIHRQYRKAQRQLIDRSLSLLPV